MQTVTTGAPPPAPRRRIDVFRVTTSESTLFVCCSPAIFGQWIHWFGRRSHECLQDRGRCKGCADNWPNKWKGYLHVTGAQGSSEGFLEITATAWAMIEAQRHPNVDLRGMMFKIRRTKGGAHGRYIVEVMDRRIDGENMPQPKDPLETLRFLWRAKKGPSQDS